MLFPLFQRNNYLCRSLENAEQPCAALFIYMIFAEAIAKTGNFTKKAGSCVHAILMVWRGRASVAFLGIPVPRDRTVVWLTLFLRVISELNSN